LFKRFFPASMNQEYHGRGWLAWVVFALGLLELGPALIHSFAPDGGAFRIAGLPDTAGRATIIGIFAWAGATQLIYAIIILAVALRYRVFIPAVLLLMLIEKSLIALNGWVLKDTHTPHHPPAMYAVLVAIPLLAGLLAASPAGTSRTLPHHDQNK
jgi:hypothetical protein